MTERSTKGRALTRVLVVIALMGATIVGISQTPATAAVTKTLTASCSTTNDLVKGLLGPAVDIPFNVTYDGPTELEPGQADAPVSFSWALSLPDTLVGLANSAGVTSVNATNIHTDIAVSGPTDLTEVPGRPPDGVFQVAPGVTNNFGPFSATLTKIGAGGVVRFTLKDVSFTIALAVAGQNIVAPIACAPGVTVINVPVKVPGAPEITQPISLEASAGQKLDIDVLSQYVKPGVDRSGKSLAVVPSTLKVLDGPATIVGGKVSTTAGAVGSTQVVTFEVCAADVFTSEGVSEVQSLQALGDVAPEPFKRQLGFTLKVGDQETTPIWNVTVNALAAAGGYQLPKTKISTAAGANDGPSEWELIANEALLSTLPLDNSPTGVVAPPASTIQAALEALPNIGAGNVAVTVPDPAQPFGYSIAFQGALAKKDVPQVILGSSYSWLPQEIKAKALGLVDLIPKPDPNAPPPPTPDQLRAEGDLLLFQGDLNGAINKYGDALAASLLAALTDPAFINSAIAFFTSLFPSTAATSTTTAGEDPESASPCSQGTIEVKVLGASVTAAPPGARLAFTG